MKLGKYLSLTALVLSLQAHAAPTLINALFENPEAREQYRVSPAIEIQSLEFTTNEVLVTFSTEGTNWQTQTLNYKVQEMANRGSYSVYRAILEKTQPRMTMVCGPDTNEALILQFTYNHRLETVVQETVTIINSLIQTQNSCVPQLTSRREVNFVVLEHQVQ